MVMYGRVWWQGERAAAGGRNCGGEMPGGGRDFRRSARKHLQDDGDLPQAYNKAWGLAAETVKAISAHRQ